VAVGELAARLAFVHIQSEPAVLAPGNSGRVQGIRDKGLNRLPLRIARWVRPLNVGLRRSSW